MTYLLGVDVARAGEDSSVFIVIKQGEEDQPHKVVYIKEIAKNTIDGAVTFTKELDSLFHFRKIYVDCTGLGAGFYDYLARDMNPPKKMGNDKVSIPNKALDKVIGVTFTIKTKIDIYSNLKILMEQGKLKFPKHPKLISQLLDFRYETTESGNMKLHHSEGGHDDCTDALALAAYGLRSKEAVWFFG